MAEFPNTDKVEVAVIAAALQLSGRPLDGSSGQHTFIGELERFLVAHKAISCAAQQATHGDPNGIDVEGLMAEVRKNLKR